MPEMHLRQPGFIYSDCRPFTKNKERIQKFKETGDSFIYQNELDKDCFQHDMAYGDFKNFTRRTASDKILRDKAFNISVDLLQWFKNFLIKKLHLVSLRLHSQRP